MGLGEFIKSVVDKITGQRDEEASTTAAVDLLK
jgi:hypothetical protein